VAYLKQIAAAGAKIVLVLEEGQSRLEPRQFRIPAGGCSPDARGIAIGAPEPVAAVSTVE
jgi:hypothetical protein